MTLFPWNWTSMCSKKEPPTFRKELVGRQVMDDADYLSLLDREAHREYCKVSDTVLAGDPAEICGRRLA